MHVCVLVFPHMQCVWRPEVGSGYCPLLFSTLYLETGYLTEVGAYQFSFANWYPPSPPHQSWDYRLMLPCLISCGSNLSTSCLSGKHFTHWTIFPAQFWCFDVIFLWLPFLWNNICSSVYSLCPQTVLSYFQIHLFCSWVVIHHLSLDLSILEFIPLSYFY